MTLSSFFITDKKKLLIIFLAGLFLVTIGVRTTELNHTEDVTELINEAVREFEASTEEEWERAASQLVSQYSDESTVYTLAYYDGNDDRVYLLQNLMEVNTGKNTEVWNADEVLSEKAVRAVAKYGGTSTNNSSYLYYVRVNEKEELTGIGILRMIYDGSGSSNPYTGAKSSRSSYQTLYEEEWGDRDGQWHSFEPQFPYSSYDDRMWETWYESSYFRNAEESFSSSSDYDKVYGSLYNMEEVSRGEKGSVVVQNGKDRILCAYTTNIFAGLGRMYVQWVFLFGLYVFFSLYWSKLAEQLVREKKMVKEVRRDSVNAIAHQLRTPLAAIAGYAENLKYNVSEEKKEKYIDQILAKSEEMDRMIEEMISISRLDDDSVTLERQEISVNEKIQELLENFDHYTDVFEVKEESQMKVTADSFYFEKMLMCLLDNAVRYRKENTKVNVLIEEKKLIIHNASDPVDLSGIFEFHQSKNGRFGFGLYFAKKAAGKNGLSLKLENVQDGIDAVLKPQ